MSAWQTVRVFISSTFRDMHAERDQLVKVVFPALREELEKYRVHLVDIDLRWGVTKEQADNDQALDVCLDQVYACRPFFIGILGERYGWVVTHGRGLAQFAESSEQIVPVPFSARDSKYGWIRHHTGKSITELEIVYGVIQNPQMRRHAFFGSSSGGNRGSQSRLFWITGDPGVGKSAFAANLTHFGRDKVIAAQFVEWDQQHHRDARRVVRSLAFQLPTRLPDYRKLLLTLPEINEEKLDRKDPAELFDYLLANPLKTVIGGGRDRQLIVIDALDEAGEAGRSPLVEMLARHAPRLPDWLGLAVTSRPESAVQTPLQGLNPFVLDTRTEANRANLRDYLRHELAPQLHDRTDADRTDADRLIGQILEKSEGVFLYAERFCDDVQHGHLSLDRPEQFPQGLGGIFCQWFQRQFPDLEEFRKDVRPALRALPRVRDRHCTNPQNRAELPFAKRACSNVRLGRLNCGQKPPISGKS